MVVSPHKVKKGKKKKEKEKNLRIVSATDKPRPRLPVPISHGHHEKELDHPLRAFPPGPLITQRNLSGEPCARVPQKVEVTFQLLAGTDLRHFALIPPQLPESIFWGVSIFSTALGDFFLTRFPFASLLVRPGTSLLGPYPPRDTHHKEDRPFRLTCLVQVLLKANFDSSPRLSRDIALRHRLSVLEPGHYD